MSSDGLPCATVTIWSSSIRNHRAAIRSLRKSPPTSAKQTSWCACSRAGTRSRRRSFDVEFPETGATYDYQWMWGLPRGFDPKSPLDYHLVSLSAKAVDRVDFRLRVPRQLERRYRARVAYVPSDSKFLEVGAVESLVGELEQRMTHAKLPSRRELTPLHRTYYFHVTPPRATDMLVLF